MFEALNEGFGECFDVGLYLLSLMLLFVEFISQVDILLMEGIVPLGEFR